MIQYVNAKTIVNKIDGSKWFGYGFNMNIYRGCHHGCIYCDSRSEVYGIEDFDQVKPKRNALAIIENELKTKRNKGIIGMGAMSDPYNKLEEKLELTRGALKLIDKYGFGVGITTKSALVVRDLDLLKKIAQHSPVIIKITITCADDKLAQKIEPHVSLPSERFEALKKIRGQGIFAGVLMLPILPYVTDNKENIESLLIKAYENNTSFICAGFGVSQRRGQRFYYLQELEKFNPEAAKLHERSYGNSYWCYSKNSKELKQLHEKFCQEHQILYQMTTIINAYQKGYRQQQISLF